MENATQALQMAFAVLIFILALTVTFSTLAQAKQTADTVLYYSDRENFQELTKSKPGDYEDGGRTVGVDTVIATIERCSREKFSVKIICTDKTYNFEYDIMKKSEIKEEIEKFIEKYYNNDTLSKTEFRETYVEVITGGQVYEGEDGTTLEENVGKKIYITYQEQ